MKIIMVIVACFYSLVGSLQAAPLYYTFEGQVTGLSDNGGIVAENSLAVGSSVSYVFLVDLNGTGTETLNDGTAIVKNDYGTYPAWSGNYFYAEYISGSLMTVADGGYFNNPGDTAEFNYGLDSYDPTERGAVGNLFGGSENSMLWLTSNSSPSWPGFTDWVTNWIEGTQIRGTNTAFSAFGSNTGERRSRISFDITLTSISSSYSPVPVPAAVWLFASGVLGLIGIAKRKKAA